MRLGWWGLEHPPALDPDLRSVASLFRLSFWQGGGPFTENGVALFSLSPLGRLGLGKRQQNLVERDGVVGSGSSEKWYVFHLFCQSSTKRGPRSNFIKPVFIPDLEEQQWNIFKTLKINKYM